MRLPHHHLDRAVAVVKEDGRLGRSTIATTGRLMRYNRFILIQKRDEKVEHGFFLLGSE